MRTSTSLSALLIAFSVSACVTDFSGKPETHGPLGDADLALQIDRVPVDTLDGAFVRAGLEALEQGNLTDAQKGFNRALKFDPTNSQLHYLNGLTYHLRVAAGDTSQKEHAAIGYNLALQYDAANYWAAYQLGHLNFDDQRYRKAQDAFAYALLFAPDNLVLIKALATASYYAQDLMTAAGAIAKAEKVAPDDPKVLRLASLIHAAGGEPDVAGDYLKRFREAVPAGNLRHVGYLGRRVGDWKHFHERGGIQLAQSTSDILGGDNTSTGLAAPSTSSYSGGWGSSSSSTTTTSSDSTKPKKVPKMAMIDVVIIRSEERQQTNKGVNLLNGLTLTLPTGTNTFNLTSTRTSTENAANTLVNEFVYNVPLQISSSYSLNIFNDNNDHNEILARPSLVALDGKKSDFFTGAVWHIQIAGGSGSAGSVSDIPVGIRLEVTPTFLNDDTVQLDVTAARAFIESNSSNPSFTTFAQVTKTTVNANVAMKFGETLILSGLAEKETEKLNDGVPFLQDIPGIQYLFSHEDTLDFTKSVLILLTPREPRYTYTDGSQKTDPENPADAKKPQPSLEELKKRPSWFRPAENVDAVFEHLKGFQFFREFRAGDVTLERWDTPRSLGARIKNAIDFIYF